MTIRTTRAVRAALLLACVSLAGPLAAQDPGEDPRPPGTPVPPASPIPPERTVFDETWITLGAGLAYSASYDGSDDYVLSPLPFLQGKLGGWSITPRPAGLAIDFIPDGESQVNFNLGAAARLNRNRAAQIEDEVVLAYGELDTAIEVGPAFGVSLSRLLNPFDSLSLSADVLWDVNGAHRGMTINPSITYFTPVSRGAAVSLSVSARHVDDDYADYYYSVPVAPAAVPAADRLPVYAASGGIDKLGANLLVAYDFSGDITDGGLAGFLIGGYSQMQGDAADTPFTSIRGDADQWFAGVGLGYTF